MYNIYIYTLLYRKRNTVVISDGNALLKIGIRFVDRGLAHKLYIHTCMLAYIKYARVYTYMYIQRSTDHIQGRLVNRFFLNAQITNPSLVVYYSIL